MLDNGQRYEAIEPTKPRGSLAGPKSIGIQSMPHDFGAWNLVGQGARAEPIPACNLLEFQKIFVDRVSGHTRSSEIIGGALPGV
jgi:hypothetical protein